MSVRTPVLCAVSTLALLLALPGDLTAQRADTAARAPAPPGSAGGQQAASTVVLTKLTTTIGLTSTVCKGNSHMGGIAWVDYNGDHWPDLFITNGSNRQHFLYRNNGNGTFTDQSSLVPKPNVTLEDGGVVFGDLENDGDQDIVVYVDNPVFNTLFFNTAAGGPNLLYRNQGNGTFTQEAGTAGIVDPQGRRNDVGGLADYDRDGFLDLYLGHWQRLSPFNEGITDYSRLLHNDGDGTFTDASASTHVNGYGRDVLTCMWFDANLDGWQDLYVGNSHPETFGYPDMDSNDILYMNSGSGFFWDETGNPRLFGDDSKAAMGQDIGDVDGDGDWDLYVTDVFDLGPEPFGNALYHGSPEGRFQDNTADLAGVATTLQNVSWPCNFADFNLDGWVDLWVGTGENTVREFLFLNDQDGTFTELVVPGFSGLFTKGGSFADYDGDGDVDLCLWNDELQSTCIYRNDSAIACNWVEFKLIGSTSNRSAIGALVRLTGNGLTQMRRVSGGDSAHSQQDLILHFGLDQATSVDIAVDWPNGLHEEFTNVGVNRLHFLVEGQGFLPEQLTSSISRWSTSAQTLTVATLTNHGGRETHSATGYGPLPYVVTGLGHQAVFAGVPANPGTVTVTSSSGANWVLPVTTVP